MISCCSPAHRFEVAPLTADLPLRKVQRLLAPELAQNGVQIILEEMPGLPLTADADQIEQVLINLVRNAADAIGQNGKIKLRARADRKRLGQKETRVVISKSRTTAKAFRSKFKSGSSIRFSPPRKPAPGWACPSPPASCKATAACSNIRPCPAPARPSGLCCRRRPTMLTHMRTEPTQILLIEDDPGITDTLQRVLADEGYRVAVERRGDDGLQRASQDPFHLVITDLKLPGLNGLELVRQLHAAQPRLPIILVTAFGTTETAIEAMKFGAYDYVLKPFDIAQMLELVGKAADSNRRMSEPVAIGEPSKSGVALVGRGAAMQAIYKEIGRVASKPVTVLVRGETGTGKELIARAIYQHSERANEPFIAINCAAIPETLLESELFGHERGAFTSAEARRIGRFEQADHGTIFLDEIGDMTLGTQVKLLRVLQDRTLQRVGGKETISVDVRVICATHRDLETAIHEKQFREDLYYRLNVVSLKLPPLRNGGRMFPISSAIFSASMARNWATRALRSIPKQWSFFRRKPGPATCASWKM